MNKNSFGKALTTLWLGAAMAFGACNGTSDNKEMGKSYHKQDSLICTKTLTDLSLNDILNDQSARDSIDRTYESKNSIWPIMTPEDAQKVLKYLTEKWSIVLYIEGFWKATFSPAKRESTFFVKVPAHFFLGVGMDGMTSWSSFDQSQYGSNVKNATKIKHDMNLIMQAFLDQMNK